MKVHTEKKEKALLLRQNGYSLNEIKRQLQVAKSTVSLWVSGVVLDANGTERIQERIRQGKINSAKTMRLQKQERIIIIDNLVAKDLLDFKITPKIARFLCAMLYWGEGNKTGSSVKFTNSDPALVTSFLSLFRKGFHIKEEKLMEESLLKKTKNIMILQDIGLGCIEN